MYSVVYKLAKCSVIVVVMRVTSSWWWVRVGVLCVSQCDSELSARGLQVNGKALLFTVIPLRSPLIHNRVVWSEKTSFK